MRDYARLYTLLLSDLGLQDGDDLGVLSDLDARAVAVRSLASSFYKKLCPLGNSAHADAAALVKFQAINAGMSDEPWDFAASSEVESVFYDYFKDHLLKTLQPDESGCFDLEFIREHMGPGPGAAQKADSTWMVSKLFESPMSYTNEDLIRYYRAALIETGSWADAERRRNDLFGFVRVEGGKLFFAPKNAEISRTCCTEANLNLLMQMAAGAFLELRLKRHFGISLSTQPDNNRELACVGSIDGSFGTIDLVSASDSIAVQPWRRYFPKGFLKSWMEMCRSEVAVLPDGSKVVLRMISTMGNGFTFPLQTVIFACVVRSVYQMMGLPSTCPKTEYGVFGDDIVVRREAYDFVCRMLTKLGFSVNVGKSFNTGLFRESCGHDYIAGVNVRGVYIRSLEDPQQVTSAINRLVRWSSNHGVLLPRTLGLMKEWLSGYIPMVPPSESDDAGLHVPFTMTKPIVSDAYWFKYRAWKRRIRRIAVKEPDADEPAINPDGLVVGFLSGVLRRRDYLHKSSEIDSDGWANPACYWGKSDNWSLSVSLRDKVGARARYQIVRKEIPWWNYLPDSKKEDGPFWDLDGRVALTIGGGRASGREGVGPPPKHTRGGGE
jgi:hypothetical protein